MRIYPAIHYTMGGLWVDYNLMTTVPGLYAIGEANFSDHGANRLGASALMQGLADGYFVLPYTIGDYLAGLLGSRRCPTDDPEFADAEAAAHVRDRQVAVGRGHQVGRPLPPRARQDHVGLLRHGPRPGRPREGPLGDPRPARGVREGRAGARRSAETVNQSLEKVQRVADFFELAELMCRDALIREESCGGHFRVEHQTAEGEAQRDDEHFAFVGAWDWQGKGTPRSSTRNRSSSTTSTSPRGATSSDGSPSQDLAAGRPERRRPLRGLRGRRHQRRHVVPRDARRRSTRASSAKAASPSCSTATAARASAARAA